jgi:hypothetical protein
VPAERVELVFAGPGDEPRLASALVRLAARTQALAPMADLPKRWRHA